MIALLLILHGQIVKSEYRAYQYIISSRDDSFSLPLKTMFVTSSLNPQGFKSYYGSATQKIELMRTWMCPGYTGKLKKTCPHPYDKEINLP